MTELTDEMGVIQSLVERFERQRLPRLAFREAAAAAPA